MSEANEEKTTPPAEPRPVEARAHKQATLKEFLGEQTFGEWLSSVRAGLRQPKNSGEYRYAVQQMRRLWSPFCGLLMPLLLILVLMATPEQTMTEQNAIPVTIEAQKANETLKDDPQTKEPEQPVEPPPPDTTTMTPDMSTPSMAQNIPGPSTPLAGPATTFSPKEASMDSVVQVKSMIRMKGVYSDRVAGVKGATGGGKGGSGGARVTGANALTESAVVRALRYLKKNQQADGSWKSQKVAMTGLVILTFLAHGETPNDSKEFGPTVQKGIEFILKSQKPDGRFNNVDGNEYAHPIATYALCEAYGMTLNPNVKVAAEKAVQQILKGQHPTGGWTYRLNPDVHKPGKDEKPSAMDGKYRDDTSYMGWCAQALKAAKMADVYPDHATLEKAIKMAIRGFQKNANPNGGFGYVGPGQGGLTSVGTLCMQLLGAANATEVHKSMDLMDAWEPSFDAKNSLGSSLQYYFYYATQCKFHTGGKRWDSWNKAMWPLYVKNQKVSTKEQSGYVDDEGRAQEIGWWENSDQHTDRPTMDTCLAALQLMVYYRYLPTYQTAKAVSDDSAVTAAGVETKGDIKVDTGNL